MNQISKPFTLKSGLKLPHRIFPGPMEGIMSPLFCQVAGDLNLVDFWITPFLRVTTGPTGKSKILDFAKSFLESGKPVILQLMGTNPDFMVQTAYLCRELGFAGVNFNLACPSKQVIAGNCGGALLKNHQFIRQLMIYSLKLSKEFSISLKIRTGFNSADELTKIAESIMYGNPDFIAVHYRTVAEAYRVAGGREERLANAVELFKNIPVIANGDISSCDDAKKTSEKTGSSGVMVARGWLKNPNLIRNILSDRIRNEKESRLILAEFISKMGAYSQKKNQAGNRNTIIDLASHLWKKQHPFFQYLVHLPFKHPEEELSSKTIFSMIDIPEPAEQRRH